MYALCIQEIWNGLQARERRSARYCVRRYISTAAAILILHALIPSGIASAENADLSVGAGVRHVLRAALSAEPSAIYSNAKDGKLRADLHVSVRISDHAPDADFFGTIDMQIAELDVGRPGTETIIWQARKCHRNRGFPKVTVMGIEGVVNNSEERIQISAVPRHIGKLVPKDEIVVTKRLALPRGNSDPEITLRALTKESRLVLDLQLIGLRCDL